MKRERNGEERDGIRKAALFLSILDEKAAEALLARFEPDVARAIEEEAKTVGSVAPDDVDAIVAEFLALSEADDETSAAEREPALERKPDVSAATRTVDWKKTAATSDERGAGLGKNVEKKDGVEEIEKNEKAEKREVFGSAGNTENNGRTERLEAAGGRERSGFDALGNVGGVGESRALDAIEPARLARTLSGARTATVAIALARLSARRRSALISLLPEETVAAAEAVERTLVRTTDAARRLEDALFNGALDDE